MLRTVVVVPCYNEACRLQPDRFLAFTRRCPDVDLLFVNDGSTDSTSNCLHELRDASPDRIALYELKANAGKAEAVRLGILKALQSRPDLVGYWDADLATPLDVIPQFRQLFERNCDLTLVMGSRVSLLGYQIERSYGRHLLGRSFATLASFVLQLPVYDTQCGAKLFRASPAVKALFSSPFRSRWIFDVEILARMIESARAGQLAPPRQCVAEFPLDKWADVAGSKLRPRHFLQAAFELFAIFLVHRRNSRQLPTIRSAPAGFGEPAAGNRRKAA